MRFSEVSDPLYGDCVAIRYKEYEYGIHFYMGYGVWGIVCGT